MEKIKELIALVLGGRLLVKGKDRTFAKMPLWFAVLCALVSPQLLIVTAVLAVGFGLQASIDRA